MRRVLRLVRHLTPLLLVTLVFALPATAKEPGYNAKVSAFRKALKSKDPKARTRAFELLRGVTSPNVVEEITRGIKKVEAAHWVDTLGIAQAMWVFEVQSFGPLLVESDLSGNSLFETNNEAVNKNIERLYAGLKKPALSRFGETDDKTQELI